MDSSNGTSRNAVQGSKVFYGWWVVGASMVAFAFSWPTIAVYTFSPFVIPLSEEFGWRRGQISYAVTIVSHTATIMTIIIGFVIDRIGARRVILPSIAAVGLTVCSLVWLSASLWHFYAVFFAIGVLGAGTSALAFTRLILNWFDRKRGLAIGLTMSGVGIGATVLPPIITYVIVHIGWREAYLLMGLMILVISGGTATLLRRERPQDMGLERDGGDVNIGPALPPMDTNAGYAFTGAVRTRQFWIMLISSFLVGVSAIGTTTHLMPLLQDRGIAATQAAQMASMLGISVIFGRILAGWLMDRIFAPYVGIVFMMSPVVGLMLLISGATGASAFFATALIGLAIGAEFDFLGYFTSRYIGLKAFGRSYGFMLASFNLGGGFGPAVMGIGFDYTGSYTSVLWTFAAFFTITSISFAILGPYPDFKRISR